MQDALGDFGLGEVSLAEYLRAVPSDEESAREAVEPYRDATTEERWQAFRSVLREMDALLDGALPFEPPVGLDPFWQRWRDPSIGRPR